MMRRTTRGDGWRHVSCRTLMSDDRAIQIAVSGTGRLGQLQLPGDSERGGPYAAVLIVAGPDTIPAQTDRALHDSLITALGQHGVAVALYPMRDESVDVVGDVRAALGWLRDRSEVDPDRMGVIGIGAGAIAAAILGTTAPDIRRVALLSPVTPKRIESGAMDQQLPKVLRRSLLSLDPFSRLAALERPVLIIHGAADAVVPPEESLVWRHAIETAGRQCEHLLLALADHDLRGDAIRRATFDHVARFFAGMSRPVETAAST